MPDPRRRPLQSVPQTLRDRLTPDARREVADLGADLDRKATARRAGTAPAPPFLDVVSDRARALWVRLDLDGPAHRDTLDPVALRQLRDIELVTLDGSTVRAVSPGGVPF